MMPDGSVEQVRRAEVLGSLADLPTRRQGMLALADRLRSINNGSHRPQFARKFSEFVKQDWEPVVYPTLKYATQEHYKYVLGVHLVPMFGDYRLCDISREAIQTFLSTKLQSGLSWKTVSHLRNAMGKVLGTAEEWGYVQENPARKTKLPRRAPKEESVILSPEQLRNLITHLSEPARSLVLLLATTGLRIGELLALRWGNVNLQSRVLRVKETVYDGHFGTPKTKRSLRAIPIGDSATAVLSGLQPQQPNANVLVFSTRKGTPLCRRNLLRRDLQPACEAAGLPVITWHSLRHSNATLLDAVGAPLGTVQALLGHATPEVTREIYLHSIPEDQRRAVENVEKLVFGPKWTQVVEDQENGMRTIN